jgi:uncharacterized membrane protein YeaQ/YmgE (transglycosylase-associated protein family)
MLGVEVARDLVEHRFEFGIRVRPHDYEDRTYVRSRQVVSYFHRNGQFSDVEDEMDLGSLLAALALGLVCGVIGRALVPNDAFSAMSGWQSWLTSTVLGLLGALLGYWIFTGLLGIGDDDAFDWGGLIGAIIGAVIVVALASYILKKTGTRRIGG